MRKFAVVRGALVGALAERSAASESEASQAATLEIVG